MKKEIKEKKVKQICQHNNPKRIEGELGTTFICLNCGQELQSWKRKATNSWIKFRFYCTRGESYIQEINGIFNAIQGGGVLFLLIQAYLGKLPAFWILPLVWAIQKATVFFLGRKDYKQWKLAQRESVLSAQFTPFMVETMEKLNLILEKKGIKYNKPSCLDYYNKDKK